MRASLFHMNCWAGDSNHVFIPLCVSPRSQSPPPSPISLAFTWGFFPDCSIETEREDDDDWEGQRRGGGFFLCDNCPSFSAPRVPASLSSCLLKRQAGQRWGGHRSPLFPSSIVCTSRFEGFAEGRTVVTKVRTDKRLSTKQNFSGNIFFCFIAECVQPKAEAF